MGDVRAWELLLKDADTLPLFNKIIVANMKKLGEPFITMAAKEAKRRGYVADKASGTYKEKAPSC